MLTNADLIILTAAVYLGGVLTEFFTALSADLIVPLLSPVTSAGKGVADFTVRLGSIELKVGDLLSKFVSLVISLFLVVTVIGVLKTYVLPAVGGKKTM